MRGLWVCVALVAAAPASAQQTASSAAPAASELDPARMALARTTVDAVWPTGTYERMIRSTMTGMVDSMMSSMFDMKMGDIAGAAIDKQHPELARQTMREAMLKLDPHFIERMQIMNQVMFEEMIPIVNRLEPHIRDGLVRVYARKFTAAQLDELNRFFATPTGRVYAPEAMLAFMEPEVMSQVTAFTPELMKEMPRIMDKVKAATAHLPLPSAPQRRGR